jgi:hypothetical protein
MVAWLYTGAPVRVCGPAHSILAVPAPEQLAALAAQAAAQGFGWMLIDGPRPMRAHWLLDPWWREQPEMPPGLARATQAGCVPLSALQVALAGQS